jgi:cysteine-rich repeat protein
LLTLSCLSTSACAPDAAQEHCVQIDRSVSVDGSPFKTANSREGAPVIRGDATASYRLSVSNCGDTELRDVKVVDEARKISLDVGTLQPAEQRIVAYELSGEEICAGSSAPAPLARVTATADLGDGTTDLEAFELAQVECDQGGHCGNGTVEPGEMCDDGNEDNSDDCRWDCTKPFCGDGYVKDGEECDDGNRENEDRCRNDCSLPHCGDGYVDEGEACDDGNDYDADICRNDCTKPFCGDGLVSTGEVCDDGNQDDTDSCRNDCTKPYCGDGKVDPGEMCDDANDDNSDDCRRDCTKPFCGDGYVKDGEECDDGNRENEDKCRNDCSLPHCGDGYVDEGEACDDGNDYDADGCRNDCTKPFCGDGQVNPGEACDDGNRYDSDGCRNDCTRPSCGDGYVDAGEQCDDGNGSDTDGCRNDCTSPYCGDGYVDAGEQCDDGNGSDTDGCRSDCSEPYCGDGIVDSGEPCDDGNENNADACRNDCTTPYCGDGIVDSGEPCDDGNENNADACRNGCTAPYCGDGIVDSGEACDDGNENNADACRNDCTVPEPCQLEIEKHCKVRGQPSSGMTCEGKVTSLTLEYTGEGCSATTNAQEGKVACEGGASFAAPISITASGKAGKKGSSSGNWGSFQGVVIGDRITFTAENGGADKFDADTFIDINNGLERITFHTSCSKPLALGDQFGSVRVVGMTSTEGGTIGLPPADNDGGTSECTIHTDSAGTQCDGKLRSLTLRYVGGGCADSSHDQSGKLECQGNAGANEPVQVLATDKKGKEVFLNQGDVQLGDLVVISAAASGEKELDADTFITVRRGLAPLQTLKIHTSCSKPLGLGDRFGAFVVVGFDGKDGSATLGTEVEYSYTVRNPSSESVVVDVVDDKLGIIAANVALQAGETETFVQSASISETTTNVATVYGTTESGLACDPAEAAATVTIAQTPTGPTSCDDGKPVSVVFEYTGDSCAASTNLQEGKLACNGNPAGAEPVHIVALSDKVQVSPGPYAIGDLVTVSDPKGKKLSAETELSIRAGGRVVQTLNIHTSCSKRLEVGDQFGALILRAMTVE